MQVACEALHTLVPLTATDAYADPQMVSVLGNDAAAVDPGSVAVGELVHGGRWTKFVVIEVEAAGGELG